MIYKTEDEVREALGLMDWKEFEIKRIQSLINSEKFSTRQKAEFIAERRGTGRTTKMLVSAVWRSQEGVVGIVCRREAQDLILEKARKMCRELGLDEDRVLPHRYASEAEDFVYSDHGY